MARADMDRFPSAACTRGELLTGSGNGTLVRSDPTRRGRTNLIHGIAQNDEGITLLITALKDIVSLAGPFLLFPLATMQW